MLTPGSRFPSKFYSPSILYSARVLLVHIEGVSLYENNSPREPTPVDTSSTLKTGHVPCSNSRALISA